MKKLLSFLIVGLLASVWVQPNQTLASIEAPRALVVEGGGNIYSLNVFWVNPNSPSLDHVNIYLSTLPLTQFGIAGTAIGTQAQPNQKGEYAITNLADQRNTENYYYVYLTAVDKFGNESIATTTLKRQTGSSADISGTDPIAGLTASAASSSSIQLDWTNPSQSDLYQIAIYRSVDSAVLKNDANFVTHQIVLPSIAGTFTDVSLSPDTTYYYRIVTEDVKGNVSEPMIISGKTLKAPIVQPVLTPPATPPVSETPPSVMPNPAKFDYRAQWISQSGVLSPDKKAHVVYAHAGDTLTFSLTLKNIGASKWLANTADNANEFKIGTWRSQDRTSQFQASNWLSSNRVVRLSQETVTGSTAALSWTMTVPSGLSSGTYREYFRPVAEYCKWFGPDGIFWDIVVS